MNGINLLCYELSKIPKIAIILQVLSRIKNYYVLELTTFRIKKKGFITSWLEIGNGKNMLISIGNGNKC